MCADLFRAVHLRGDQSSEQLVVAADETGRVDDVRPVDRRRSRSAIDVFGAQHPRRIDDDVELRPLAALNQHARDAGQAVEPRLDLVAGELPEILLRTRCPTSGCSR